ncbi:MAG TPA: helix-hairpin-helix domain-containing protein [Candidatus Brocadiia bacterium]|nr:helix-hairpin-helix domain-containing protein [Candidatus Brocadiia bacterium]
MLKSVTFQVGRTGVITPVAHFDPVRLAGTNVSNANLHNFDEIQRLDIHIGDTVLVQKAGEIIPQVMGVVKEKRPKDAKPIAPPAHCPECQTKLKWDPPREGFVAFRCVNPGCELYLQRRQRKAPRQSSEKRDLFGQTQAERAGKARGGQPPAQEKRCRGCGRPVEATDHLVDLRCCNPDCPAQIREHILHFAGRDQMDIENLGPVLVEKLLSQGLVKHLADLYRLKEDDLKDLDRMGELSARNVIEAIEKSKTRGLARVLAGLGVPKVGATLARDLAAQFPSIDDLLSASEADIRRALVRADKGARDKAQAAIQSAKDFIASNPEKTQEIASLPLADQIRAAKVKGISGSVTLPKLLPALEERFDTLADIASASVEELAECLHEQGIVSTGVHEFFHHRGGRQLVESLREAGVDMTQAPAAPAGPQPLANKNLVVTGTLKGYSRSQIEELIRSLGGRAGSSVTSKTHYLVAGENPGSKLDKARELNIPILTEDAFNQLIAQPPASDR